MHIKQCWRCRTHTGKLLWTFSLSLVVTSSRKPSLTPEPRFSAHPLGSQSSLHALPPSEHLLHCIQTACTALKPRDCPALHSTLRTTVPSAWCTAVI